MILQQADPIIVHVVQQPVKSTTIADVLIGAIGLTGVLVLAAVLLGAVLGGALIAFKVWRSRMRPGGALESEIIHIV
jgi:hypothetical protein